MAIVHIAVALGVAAVTAIGYGLACGYQHRSKINQLRKQGIVILLPLLDLISR